MLKKFVKILGGDPDKKRIEAFKHVVEQINLLEGDLEKLSDEQLSQKTNEFRVRLASGESLDDILPEAYAVVREVSKRTIGLRHYDVQMIGGIAMHQGIIAEMRTGEGKTLAATLPLYLNALALNPEWVSLARQRWGEDPHKWSFERVSGVPVGRGVHLVTVNDYLARRDARWMAPIYDMLGLSVGVLQMAARTEHGKKAFLVDLERKSPHEDQHQLRMVPRKEAYAADITYGTNNEFGFDYLRDNMAMRLEDRVQRGHYYAIIDEVDNVLIDEARTPLIISGPSHEDTEWYVRMAQVVRQLRPEDYEISERDRTVTLTEIGETHVEEILGIALRDPDRPEDVTPEQARLLGYLEQALRAEFLYKRNKEYIVQGGKVVIVDEFTGRLMPGRRWSDGLHQAVEAKEGVRVQSENVTYATITIQNYFRMYEKLAGMTGTAVTEAEEFNEIYNLDALAIPTNLEYQAMEEDSPLIALEDRDEYGYKYTYYAYRNDPERKPVFYKRKDYPDVIYRSVEAKLRAIVKEIVTYHVQGRPILVGTTSVEMSELLSGRLRAEPIRRLMQVLLIRDAWLDKHQRVEDGRQIPELEPLNPSLDTLRASDLRQLIRQNDLGISLNPEDEANLSRLLALLGLEEADRERLLSVLKAGIPHQVLNARKHTEESQIIAGAGAYGAVTIATNMAGRGVDIKLGGELAEEVITEVNRVLRRNGFDPYGMTMAERRQALLEMEPEQYGIYESEVQFFLRYMDDMERVRALGGLHVIGSERHEARRIDNQLRGRAARQGDPGSSRFFLSLEDELMVRFGGQQLDAMLSRLNVDEQLPIENNLVSRIVEQSQTRVEGANFDVRKHLLEYDDVLNTQRAKIYNQRDRVFTKDDLSEDVREMLETEVRIRVPQALEDDEGPWRLLSWLEQIQPSAPIGNRILPSYTLRLILEKLSQEHPRLQRDEAIQVLTQIAGEAIQAEAEHVIRQVRLLIDQSIERLEQLLEERLETLDTFLDGLTYEDTETPGSPKDLLNELQGLLHVRLQLPQSQLRKLLEEPDEVGDELRNQVEEQLLVVTLRRLLGAVERVLRQSLGIVAEELVKADWDEISQQVEEAIRDIYDQRYQRFIGNGTSGQLVRDLELALKRLPATAGRSDGGEEDGDSILSEQDIYSLLVILPEGRRQDFDKKSHRKIWVRTTRLTFIYLAAQQLNSIDAEQITEDVLNHLKNAQDEIQAEWGEMEFKRLENSRILDLDQKSRRNLENALGEDVYAQIADKPLKEIQEDWQQPVKAELGRMALTGVYRELLLRVISELWVEYLTQMEALRVSIGLEAYAQRDPLVQYKTRAFEMFQNLMRDMRLSVVTRMFTFQPRNLAEVQATAERQIAVSAEAPAGKAQVDQKASKAKRRRRRRR